MFVFYLYSLNYKNLTSIHYGATKRRIDVYYQTRILINADTPTRRSRYKSPVKRKGKSSRTVVRPNKVIIFTSSSPSSSLFIIGEGFNLFTDFIPKWRSLIISQTWYVFLFTSLWRESKRKSIAGFIFNQGLKDTQTLPVHLFVVNGDGLMAARFYGTRTRESMYLTLIEYLCAICCSARSRLPL